MKAILDNFKKISDSEFHLKKDMQFATIIQDENENVKIVDYQDNQNIEIGDILSYNSTDYTITAIDANDFHELKVAVQKIEQPGQDVPDKTNYVPRKMTPRKARRVISTAPVSSNVIKTETDKPIQRLYVPKTNPIKEETTKPKPTEPKSTKQNIFKRFAGWISRKLSNYSNS
tara:strand:+ start:41 stop:559 length:519 start_codon:yes stop_codon:yes gene_type:complete